MKLTHKIDDNLIHVVHPVYELGAQYVHTLHDRGRNAENSLVYDGTIEKVNCEKCLTAFERHNFYLETYKNHTIGQLAKSWFDASVGDAVEIRPGLKMALIVLLSQKTGKGYKTIGNRLRKDFRRGHLSDFS